MSPVAQEMPALPPVQSADAPQNSLLVIGSMQVSPQATSPGWQLATQTPASQNSPAPHSTPALSPLQSPEAPQKLGLVSGSTQASLHSMSPAAHSRLQTPMPSQRRPSAQALSQAPQLLLSRLRSTQSSPHSVKPSGQPADVPQPASVSARPSASAPQRPC